jgi:Cytochrome c oxidase subunit IV
MARHGELDSSAGRRFYSDVAIFGALAAFLVLGGVVYGVFSGEASGTILLVLTGVFAAIVAGYLGLQDRLERSAARTQAPESEPVDDDQFLPHASIWPFEMGAGMALTGAGVVLGWAILVPGLVLLLHSIAGWIIQSRHRSLK